MVTAYGTGSLFNKSIYTGYLRAKNIPILIEKCPEVNENIPATKIMSSLVKSLPFVVKVSQVASLLK